MRKILTGAQAIFLFLFFLGQHVHAEESHWSLNITGVSWHENQKQRDESSQVNPGLGLRYDFTKNWYGEANYVAKNSLNGTTSTLGGGWHTEVAKISGQPFLLGGQIMWMDYQAPNRTTTTGFIPALTAEHKITKQVSIVYYLFPQNQHSVLFIGVNVRL